MARYRPVSPEQAWRSSKSAELTISERYGELYLLTTPFANTIGCYQIVPRIAAAEAGLSQEEFQNVLERLNSRRIASFFEEGYVLVRTWFRHSSWESTLQGNVAKAALREISALPPAVCDQWCQAAVEVGVPEEIVRIFVPEVSPLEGACKDLTLLSNGPAEPLEHNNHNENVTQQELPPELELRATRAVVVVGLKWARLRARSYGAPGAAWLPPQPLATRRCAGHR